MRINIDIDCDPFCARPDTYFNHIWKKILNYTTAVPEPVSKCFGNWSWVGIEVTDSQHDQIGEFLKNCYNQGKIRYASW